MAFIRFLFTFLWTIAVFHCNFIDTAFAKEQHHCCDKAGDSKAPTKQCNCGLCYKSTPSGNKLLVKDTLVKLNFLPLVVSLFSEIKQPDLTFIFQLQENFFKIDSLSQLLFSLTQAPSGPPFSVV